VIYVFYVLHIAVCMFLILVVLLQQGKGADLSVFGGGSTQTAFGARGAATILHKLTVTSFILFIVTTMAIAIMSSGPGGASVMGEALEAQSQDLTSSADAVRDEGQGAGETTAPPATPEGQVEAIDELAGPDAGGAGEPPDAAPDSP
jgi:preprotein translocase subunit SecG